jgi:hypothetical protein
VIYLAIHGKVFGPFNPNELTKATLSEYRWIYREDRASEGWQPIDPIPAKVPAKSVQNQEAILTIPDHGTAISGSLEAVRARGGWLHSTESTIRLAVGTPVRLQLVGEVMRAVHARVERVESGLRNGIATVRYHLAWDPIQAP